MKKNLICIACPIGCHLEIDLDNDYKVSGNQCKRGETYGKKELINPTRIITSTVIVKGAIHNRLPVKTDGEVPKDVIFDIMKQLNNIEVASPISLGDVIIKNVCNTGINIVATRTL